MTKENNLASIVSVLKKVDLPGNRSIYSLPNDLVYVLNNNDAVSKMYGVMEGIGHEPEIFEKMMLFMKPGENFIEVGANYGDYSLQMAKILSEDAKIYAFEPGRTVEYIKNSLLLNGLSNLVVENFAVLDKEMDLWFSDDEFDSIGNYMGVTPLSRKVASITLDTYFNNTSFSVSAIRLDAQGAECRVIKGAKQLIDSSSDIKLFVEWERHLVRGYGTEEEVQYCLDSLIENGFIFLDLINFNSKCDYSNYLIPKEYLLKHDIEFIAMREESIKKLSTQFEKDNIACNNTVNYLLFDSVLDTNILETKKYIAQKADINYISTEFGASSIHMAAQIGNKELITILLDAGANIETIAPKNELTALCIAAQNKHSDIVQLLIKNGANIDCGYPSGANALYVSAYLGDAKSALMLLKAGASQDIIVEDKNIMDRANQSGNAETAKLFELGVDAFCKQIIETGRDSALSILCEE
jgi:FkbM family methyltransferase